ncbi:MAG: 2-(1,2-epoxy-1,2-dihydrophenyl)acetyl-CoA isomerase [Proteobacteria bacterium]|nr:MAG: 2-(1,2-epoxy-1,2-dihydrophenyl)acetyl-CoA isomerase [Pseudomonadota bacterium]
MSYNTIELQIDAGIATLALNRPNSLNSFNGEMLKELHAAFDTIQADKSLRCLVITGNGRGFCAGQDLSDDDVSGDNPINLGDSLEKNYNPLVRAIMTLEMPVIGAINGVAAGAGANIALACDIVIAARSASFIQAFCRLGLVPDAGGTWTLPRLVGRARAMGLSMLGDKVSAEQAAQWGMIWQCVDDDQLMPEVNNLAAHLAAQPTQGLGYIKQAINASECNDLNTQLDLERDLQRLACQTADYREGVQAFINKRKPEFKGY